MTYAHKNIDELLPGGEEMVAMAVMTMKEAASALRISEDTLMRRVAARKIRTLPRGKGEKYLFATAEIERIIRLDAQAAYCNAARGAARNRRLTPSTTVRWRTQLRTNPTHVLARRAVYSAVRAGRLAKKPCFVCGHQETEAHHEDYDRPLDVVWMCRTHHAALHTQRGDK